MKSAVFFSSWIASVLVLGALTAGEQSRPPIPGDDKAANQMRAEKLERLLVALTESCKTMLDAQVGVREESKRLDNAIRNNADKKPSDEDRETFRRISDKQKAIVAEVSKTIDMLTRDGSAAAFPEVFEQVRADMKVVQGRLEISEVGPATLAIQDDIIETLKEMIDSLTHSK